MFITEVTVSTGTTFNNPYESYSNFRPSVELKAAIGPQEDPHLCVKALQAHAEEVLAEHKAAILSREKERHDREEEEMRKRYAEAEEQVPFGDDENETSNEDEEETEPAKAGTPEDVGLDPVHGDMGLEATKEE